MTLSLQTEAIAVGRGRVHVCQSLTGQTDGATRQTDGAKVNKRIVPLVDVFCFFFGGIVQASPVRKKFFGRAILSL